MRNKNFSVRRNVRNNNQVLVESIMAKIEPIISNVLNEMDWEGIQQRLADDNRPYARRIGNKVADYINTDVYRKNYNKKYKPKTREELKQLVDEQIELQGGEVVDLNMIDTSLITDMSDMFSYCPSFTSLDLSTWDTSNVTDISWMFSSCTSLTSLDVSIWDTSKVDDMNFMFAECASLTSLDVSKWDTSNVTDMGNMFDGCKKLRANISAWNTKNVRYKKSMLKGARNIECNWDDADKLLESRYSRRMLRLR